ncbi:MAG: putative sulfate exporter family transporter [Cytophagia bacterium]|nr:putative sulfate exporter family transporter [Cytophagia bacterium]
MSKEKSGLIISEDWVATGLGFFIIIFILFQIVLPTPVYGWSTTHDLFIQVLNIDNLSAITRQGLLILVVIIFSARLTGKSVSASIKVFLLLFCISQLAFVFGGNSIIKFYGLEAVLFSLLLGLVVSRIIKLPAEWQSVLSTELYVKIGLVLLGTSIIFSDVLKAGFLGLLQSLIVVISVWYFAFWVSKKLKVEKDLALMLSSAVSICGVSAAIATAGAIKGDSKKLSFIISLVLVTAIPMMIGMPYLAKFLNLTPEITGAWLGGTIDTTGAVVAAGSLAGEAALKVSTIVKFSQNVLLGLAAFAISIYWAYTSKTENAESPSFKMIWARFPKFVIGFIMASVLFSFFIAPEKIILVKDSLKSIQTLWFVLAFTSIGFETKFTDFTKRENRRPLFAFLLAQFFNIAITLLVSWFLFS